MIDTYDNLHFPRWLIDIATLNGTSIINAYRNNIIYLYFFICFKKNYRKWIKFFSLVNSKWILQRQNSTIVTNNTGLK